jgi:hypothetical protein
MTDKRTITPINAQDLAINFVRFLAQDDDRLTRFLQLTGIDLESVKTQLVARDAGFLASVIEYAMSDESLLLQYCAEVDAKPEVFARAQYALSGQG